MTKDRSLISKEKLLAWSLPFVLAVALSNGLIYLCTVPPWQGPDEPSHFAYVALLDHYALDYRLVEALAIPGAGKQEQDLVRAVNASLDRNNFTRYLIGYPTPGSAANLGESLWWEVHQPATYYWVCAAVLRSARTLGIAPDPYVDPAGALLWVRGTSLVLSLGVVALAWLGGLLLGGRRDPWLRVLLPITVALLPMHAFIASTANNDIAAELVCSALFVTLVALFRWPHGRRGIGLAALCLALSFATRYTKDSAYQVLPVVGLGLLAWLGPAISSFGRGRAVKWLGAGRARWGLKFPALLMLIVLLLVAGVLLSAFERQNFAAGWDIRYAPFTRAARVASQTAHGGNYVIQTGSFSQPIVAEQMLAPGTPQTFKATFSGWARLASPALPGSTRAQLAIQREDKDLGSASAYLDPSGAWTPLTATANIPKGSTPVYLALLAYGAGSLVQYDDLSLHVEWTGPVWDDPAFPLTILNPSGEQGVLALRPGIASLLPFTARQMIDTAVNPQPFSKKQLTAYYASNEFTSFWGDFGWLSLPLPDSIYALLEVVCAAALLGIIVRLVRSWGSWTWQEWLGLATITGLAMGTAGVYLIQITVLANQHLFAFPQGRYLFVAIIPLMWLLLYGMHSAWVGAVWAALRVRRFVAAGSRATASRNESVPEEAPASASRPWAAWLWLNALWLFAAYCLLALVGPYFHS